MKLITTYNFILFLFLIFVNQCKLFESEPIAIGKKIAVATDHPLASQAALDIYKKGGNIVDSYVASSFVLCVVRPQSTGLGGGGFALIRWNKSKSSYALDFRERAPLAASEKMYINADGTVKDKESMFGYRSVAVPGMVKGLIEIHSKFGKLPREEVLLPAQRLADEGFTIYENLAESIEKSLPEMNTPMKKIFAPGGNPLKKGDILIQKDLARTIYKIGIHGSDEFYKLQTAESIHSDMAYHGGLITRADLMNYKTKERKPISIKYRGFEILSFPPPSSAVFFFQILKILEKYDLTEQYSSNRKLYAATLIESMGSAFRDREKYGGDPDFFSIDTTELLKDTYIQKKADRIQSILHLRKNQKLPQPEESKMPKTLESYNTTHISITDESGNSISSTHSINYTFGSRVVIHDTGLIMNDTMDDFSITPNQANAYGLIGGNANSIQPNKTPLSSMSPTIVVRDGENWLNLGAPGGSFIFTSILNTLVHRIDLNFSPIRSVSHPRIHYQNNPDLVFLEEALKPELEGLQEWGYNLKFTPSRGKVFYTERADGKKIIAVSDPRGQGIPIAE